MEPRCGTPHSYQQMLGVCKRIYTAHVWGNGSFHNKKLVVFWRACLLVHFSYACRFLILYIPSASALRGICRPCLVASDFYSAGEPTIVLCDLCWQCRALVLCRSEGFPRTGYFIPGCDGTGAWWISGVVRVTARAYFVFF